MPDKIALVTGASRGLGRSMAQQPPAASRTDLTRRLLLAGSAIAAPSGWQWLGRARRAKGQILNGRGGFRTCDLSRVKRALSH